jgi:hypothetical protein
MLQEKEDMRLHMIEEKQRAEESGAKDLVAELQNEVLPDIIYVTLISQCLDCVLCIRGLFSVGEK